jgi:FtsZ-binding cell division protein ZapB
MSVSSTDKLDRLAMVLYDRPAGRNIIEHAIDTIHTLREAVETHKREVQVLETSLAFERVTIAELREELYQVKKRRDDRLAKLREAVGAFNADIGKGCYGNNCLWPRNRGMATDYACNCLDVEHSTRAAVATLLEAAREVVK